MCRSGQLKLTEAQLKNGAALQAGALYVESGIVELFDTLVAGTPPAQAAVRSGSRADI